MKTKFASKFKDSSTGAIWFESWVEKLETTNSKVYTKLELNTSLGNTVVFGLNLESDTDESLVIFPGARTTALFWDIDNNLEILGKDLKIYLVETNGLPNLSEGLTPDIHSLDYGWWASEVLDQLGIEETTIAGASFGGLICAKLCLVSPSKVRTSILLNPGCLQAFSLLPQNLYYNLLPIVSPSRKNIASFLDKAIFCKPFHTVSDPYYDMIIEYEYYALTQFIDNTQKPYYMIDELAGIETDTYLILGEKDIHFPYRKSSNNAARIPGLKDVVILANTGHGIETSAEAIRTIKRIRATYQDYATKALQLI